MRPIKVTNQFLSDITWLEASACRFIVGNHIDVWSVSPDPMVPITNELLTIFSPDELTRVNRFFQQRDRDRFINSRWALRNIIGRYIGRQPAEVVFETGKNKKPHIKDAGINLHYNMSHSAGHVLIAVASSIIGVDIEFINNDFSYKEVLADNFSLREVDHINETEHINRFFKLWTRKEAVTKATAQGLDCDLRLLPGLDGPHTVEPGRIASDDDWVIDSFNIDKQYAASVAHSPLTNNMSFYNFNDLNSTLF